MLRTHMTGVGLEEVVSETFGKQFYLLEIADFITSLPPGFANFGYNLSRSKEESKTTSEAKI